jgi:hypothetical protein
MRSFTSVEQSYAVDLSDGMARKGNADAACSTGSVPADAPGARLGKAGKKWPMVTKSNKHWMSSDDM